MSDPAALVEGSERLTSIFGYWPSFHDAEVIEFYLWRGDVKPDAGRYTFPTLTTKIHLWELTSEVDARGFLVLRHHTLAVLRFHDVEGLHVDHFNHQNAIFGLSITTEEVGTKPPLRVEMEPASGIGAKFCCRRIELLHAKPWTIEGNAPSLARL